MSNVPIKDANETVHKVDVFTRTEGADTVETQAVALVDPATGQLVLGAPSDAPATDDTGSFSLIALYKRALGLWSSLASVVRATNSPFTDGDKGLMILGKRRDSDTTLVADGDYAGLNMDEVGRLKVATQPGSVPAVSGDITAVGQLVAIATGRIGTLSIAMVATTLVGHNAIFEFSNDSTNGTDGNWKTVQAVRTDSNIIEATTGVLAATPVYGWELNVSAYAWFRVRPTAHTGGTATYVLKPGAYASEPVPSSQTAPLQTFNFSQPGVIAVNSVLMLLDCLNFRSIQLHCVAIGTGCTIASEWSGDGVNWIAAAGTTDLSGSSATFNSAQMRTVNCMARYWRLRVSIAATGGTTTLVVAGNQLAAGPVASQTITGNITVNASTNRIGLFAGSCIWYDDSATVLAASATFTGSSRDLAGSASGVAITGSTTYVQELRASAESDQAGTLWLEVSRDNTNWRRIKAAPTVAVTGGGQYAEIVHRPSWRYARIGFTNGATLQTRFSIGTILMAA